MEAKKGSEQGVYINRGRPRYSERNDLMLLDPIGSISRRASRYQNPQTPCLFSVQTLKAKEPFRGLQSRTGSIQWRATRSWTQLAMFGIPS